MFRILTLAAVGAAVALAAQAQPGHDAAGAAQTHMMMIQGGLAALDTNGDGFVSREEFLAHPSAMFDRLDTNHDGRLSKDELAAMAGIHQVCKVQGPGDAQPKDAPCAGMAGAADPGIGMMMHHMAAMLDTNHDGRVSWQEFQEGMRAHFEALDKNKDGYLTPDEAPGGQVIIEQHSHD